MDLRPGRKGKRAASQRVVIRNRIDKRNFARLGIVTCLLLIPVVVVLMLQSGFLAFGVTVLTLLTLGILFSIRAYNRNILLLDEYIVIQNWYGLPRPYKYDQITSLAKRRGSDDEPYPFHYTVTFSDGRKTEVTGLESEMYRFTSHIREKTGLEFGEGGKMSVGESDSGR